MTNHSDRLEQTISEFIAKKFLLGEANPNLDPERRLFSEGIVDSLGIFLLIDFLNEEFGIEIEADDVVLENFETVNSIKALVTAKLSAG